MNSSVLKRAHSPSRQRWLLAAFGLAILWNLLYDLVLNSFELTNYQLVTGPKWLQRLAMWSPDAIGGRFAHALGFRWSFAKGATNWQIMLIVAAVGVFLWTAIFYGGFILWDRFNQSRHGAERA